MERIPMAEYQARPGMSRSTLWRVLRSPMHAMFAKQNPQEPTGPMQLGSATHTLTLEPHLFDREFVVADVDRRTKVGKETAAMYAGAGLTLLKPDQFAQVRGMAEAVRAHPTASALLSTGEAELSVFWTDEATGVPCKCRPDWTREDRIIVDLKSCQDASPEGFQRAAWSSGYQMQAAFYLDAMKGKSFVFIAVESEPPHAVAVYVADDDFLFLGRSQYQQALKRVAECSQTGVWPGYSDEIMTLSPPKWALFK